MRHIEPFEIVTCSTKNGTCTTVTRTQWRELKTKMGTEEELRGSSNVIERERDFIGIGHFQDGRRYSFFWFSFTKSLPFTIKSASKPFRMTEPNGRQFISSLAAVDDWYLISFTVEDETSQWKWFLRSEVDLRINEITRN